MISLKNMAKIITKLEVLTKRFWNLWYSNADLQLETEIQKKTHNH